MADGIYVAGVDIGFTATGAVVALVRPDDLALELVDCQCWRTEPQSGKTGCYVAHDDIRRVQSLARSLGDWYERWRPVVVALEAPTGGGKGARATRCMALATGLSGAIVALCGWPAVWVQPADVKLAAAGSRSASKEAVQRGAMAQWPAAPWPVVKAELEHVADAAGALLAAESSSLMAMARTMVTERKADSGREAVSAIRALEAADG